MGVICVDPGVARGTREHWRRIIFCIYLPAMGFVVLLWRIEPGFFLENNCLVINLGIFVID